MRVGDNDTEMLVDLIRSAKNRGDALSLLNAICRTAHSEGVIDGSRATGSLLNKTFDALLGVPAGRPQ